MVEKARFVVICARLREKTRTQILQLEVLLEIAKGMINFLRYFTQGELVQLAGHKLHHAMVQSAFSTEIAAHCW